MEIFDQIHARLSRGSASDVVVVLVPTGASAPLVRKRVVSELRVRDVPVHMVALDSASDLVADLSVLDGEGGVALASGLEDVADSGVQDYLRRTSFRRSTLSKLTQRVVLVLPQRVWAWLARELPDLARWVVGPFVAPVSKTGRVLMASRAEVGLPIPPSEDVDLDPLRGMATPLDELLAQAEERLVVLGGPLGVGLTHIAARLQQEQSSSGRRSEWPPGPIVINGKRMVAPLSLAVGADTRFPKFLPGFPNYPNIREWLEAVDENAFLIVTRGWLPNEGIEWLSTRRAGLVLGTAQQGLMRALGRASVHYVPPVFVEGDGAVAKEGRSALAKVLTQRVEASGLRHEKVASNPVFRRIAALSGGVPGIAIEILQRSRDDIRDRPLTDTDVNQVAERIADKIDVTSGPDRFDRHCSQLLLAPDGPREVVHPLLRLRR